MHLTLKSLTLFTINKFYLPTAYSPSPQTCKVICVIECVCVWGIFFCGELWGLRRSIQWQIGGFVTLLQLFNNRHHQVSTPTGLQTRAWKAKRRSYTNKRLYCISLSSQKPKSWVKHSISKIIKSLIQKLQHIVLCKKKCVFFSIDNQARR